MSLRAFTRVNGTLRSKFLLSLTLITTFITSAVLFTVQYRVRLHVREEIAQSLADAVVTFQRLQQQRESTLERSTALLAALPPVKALMTSQDPATIQDASAAFWKLAGSQVFVLADRSGQVAALHTSASGFSREAAQHAIDRYVGGGEPHDWWFGGGHLFQVFLAPIYFGPPEAGHPIGILAAGFEIDAGVADDVTRVASSGVGFGYEQQLIISTVPSAQIAPLAQYVARVAGNNAAATEIGLGGERFLATSVRLSPDHAPLVTLTLLKSFDQATAFLRNLDRWILAIGALGVVAGIGLVLIVSTTFTKPLERLVSGVRALEQGDFAYRLDLGGSDEVSALTAAFDRMRRTLHDAQGRLLEAERLATIGRMASTMSHDLRHPLTAVLAYAEFLSEANLTEGQRKDFFHEIRIAVNRMLDEINSLLGFSKESAATRPEYGRVDTVVDRAIKTVKALPEFESLTIGFSHGAECVGWFDSAKLERAILNLLFNAAEAVSPDSGRIDVICRVTESGTEIRVADNGPGIPAAIADTLFQPFVSHGKEKGIGLGLTVVQSIMQQHQGEASVESTGAGGTVFRLFFPAVPGSRVEGGAVV
jgi:signal transduction histidine kinase